MPSSEKTCHSLQRHLEQSTSRRPSAMQLHIQKEQPGGIILSRGVKLLLISFCLIET